MGEVKGGRGGEVKPALYCFLAVLPDLISESSHKNITIQGYSHSTGKEKYTFNSLEQLFILELSGFIGMNGILEVQASTRRE